MTNMNRKHAKIIASYMIEKAMGCAAIINSPVYEKYPRALEMAFRTAADGDWNTLLDFEKLTEDERLSKEHQEKVMYELTEEFDKTKDLSLKYTKFVSFLHAEHRYLDMQLEDFTDELKTRLAMVDLID